MLAGEGEDVAIGKSLHSAPKGTLVCAAFALTLMQLLERPVVARETSRSLRFLIEDMAQESIQFSHALINCFRVAQRRSRDHLLPEGVVPVNFLDTFHYRIEVRIIVAVDETVGVECLSHARVAPIDGDGAGCKSLYEFLGSIAVV